MPCSTVHCADIATAAAAARGQVFSDGTESDNKQHTAWTLLTVHAGSQFTALEIFSQKIKQQLNMVNGRLATSSARVSRCQTQLLSVSLPVIRTIHVH